MAPLGRIEKVLIGECLFAQLINVLNASKSRDIDRLNDYFSNEFGIEFEPDMKPLEKPSDNTLAGAGLCTVLDCSFRSPDLTLTLRFKADLSWMINDGEQYIHSRTFIPYEARLIAKVAGRKKEDVIIDSGEFMAGERKIEWNVETAFMDRGIHRFALDALKAVERARKKRARDMMQGAGMDLYEH